MPILAVLALAGALVTQVPAAALRIVVIEGEGAVNIIQQKTAVRPLVEVRDRNNVPVSGATVTFALNGQPAAFANGAATMTVTTNAQGQAAAAGFNAVRPGAVQIQVSAAHQGQTAAAMISQTNFATAAAASAAGVAAGAAASGGAASGGAAAGGGAATTAGATGAGAAGGGISATTIAIVGGAVAGGAVVATQVVKSSSDGDHYEGPFSAPFVFVNSTGTSSCTFNRTMSGTITIDLHSDGTGLARVSGTMTPTGFVGSCSPENTRNFSVPDGTVTGGPSNITFTTANSTLPITKATFNGSLSGSTITGTLTIEETTDTSTSTQTFTGRGSGTATVTLTK